MLPRRDDESSEIDCLVGKDTYACEVTKTLFREGASTNQLIMKKRVLLVDDDLQVRSFMDEALHFLGFEVIVAAEVATALAQLDQADFDLVVTDHRMPGREGLDLVRELRARRFEGRIYVVSGVLSPGERHAYEGLRVDGMASKPLSLSELSRLLRDREAVRVAFG